MASERLSLSDKNMLSQWKAGVIVLKNWIEVGDVINYLANQNHRTHNSPYKSWDLHLIIEMIDDLDRNELVIDLGASVLGSVRLLYELGFKHILGYDLAFSKYDRLIQIRDWFDKILKIKRLTGPPYKLKSKSLYNTGLKDGCACAVTCLSVIEHGIDHSRFFAEVSRLLKQNGRLFLSTDYWEPKIDTSDRRMFDQPWTIFSKNEIETMIEKAKNHGLYIDGKELVDFSCEDAVVVDGNHACTSIAMRFYKK